MRVFLLLLLILPAMGCVKPPEQAETPPPAPVSTGPTPAQLVLREKLAELEKIRKTQEFQYYGISAGGPYGDWDTNLDKAMAPYSLTFKEKLGAEELKALLREYVSSRGQDTKASEFFRQTVSEAAGN
jgi:hypothetical protein